MNEPRSDDEYRLQPVDRALKSPFVECPNCSASLDMNAVLCTACGFHMAKGKVLVSEESITTLTDDHSPRSARIVSGLQTAILVAMLIGGIILGIYLWNNASTHQSNSSVTLHAAVSQQIKPKMHYSDIVDILKSRGRWKGFGETRADANDRDWKEGKVTGAVIWIVGDRKLKLHFDRGILVQPPMIGERVKGGVAWRVFLNSEWETFIKAETNLAKRRGATFLEQLAVAVESEGNGIAILGIPPLTSNGSEFVNAEPIQCTLLVQTLSDISTLLDETGSNWDDIQAALHERKMYYVAFDGAVMTASFEKSVPSR